LHKLTGVSQKVIDFMVKTQNTTAARIVAGLRRIQENYFAHSALLTAAEWSRRPLLTRTLQGTARLADSFL
jgi:hypothetical protein